MHNVQFPALSAHSVERCISPPALFRTLQVDWRLDSLFGSRLRTMNSFPVSTLQLHSAMHMYLFKSYCQRVSIDISSRYIHQIMRFIGRYRILTVPWVSYYLKPWLTLESLWLWMHLRRCGIADATAGTALLECCWSCAALTMRKAELSPSFDWWSSYRRSFSDRAKSERIWYWKNQASDRWIGFEEYINCVYNTRDLDI